MLIYTRTVNPTFALCKLVHYCLKLKDTPAILFKSLQDINELVFPDVIRIIKKNISGNVFCLLPENFLYSMALTDEEYVRTKGLEMILLIRDTREGLPGPARFPT